MSRTETACERLRAASRFHHACFLGLTIRRFRSFGGHLVVQVWWLDSLAHERGLLASVPSKESEALVTVLLEELRSLRLR